MGALSAPLRSIKVSAVGLMLLLAGMSALGADFLLPFYALFASLAIATLLPVVVALKQRAAGRKGQRAATSGVEAQQPLAGAAGKQRTPARWQGDKKKR